MKQKDHPLFARWRFWKQACYNPNCPNYPAIGARGVRVGFDNFWAMATWVEDNLGLPPLGMSSKLARIDQDGDYAAGNLRWETGSELVSRSAHANIVEYKGRRQCLSAWAKELGFYPATLYNRINIYGWTIERALETPTDLKYKAK